MEIPSNENPQPSVNSTGDADQQHNVVVPDVLNHGCKESKHEIADSEVRGILEVIASTGRFWHDWDKLKSMLSFQLKQVLSEYPDAEMTSEQQNASLGEPYLELVKRVDEALHGFTEGPPFTLQRLCEILLDARSIYPNLSKLALALEKNLLVTSMLSMSTDPYLQSVMQKIAEPEKASEEPKLHSDLVQMGWNNRCFEDIVGSSETSSVQTDNS
ncbi:hypothetical protein M0R45_038434 [Rubus argutus]|uniref:Serine/threonine-protein phosphatase 4 regulatory subunit 2 n=1 Tax=Rubus argutus TaxID=59490 RepID=A0AAW1W314_RUBAR